MNTPNPGSDEAIAAGCRCPVLDNAHGRGWMGGVNAMVMAFQNFATIAASVLRKKSKSGRNGRNA